VIKEHEELLYKVAFFLAFSYWVLKSYGRILNQTEKLLSDVRN
jgi:hypothetical protein